ncbi:MAG: SDR family oxidoreductase [Oligoflexales bacterium]|nr:SDR family oxidoreductase [Oligoflexales bacterium]
MSKVFVTGGTGFLGMQILGQLLEQGHEVYALARKRSLNALDSKQYAGVRWVEGDICESQVLANPQDFNIIADCEQIIHAAALYDLTASPSSLYDANVVGTHNILSLAERMKHLKAFHHISTLAVAGGYKGIFTEDMFDEGQKFPDAYSSTKFAAEGCVRKWLSPVAKYVHRLGVVVGHSKTGAFSKVDGPYYLIRGLKRLLNALPLIRFSPVYPIPYCEKARIFLVPVDIAVHALIQVVDAPVKPVRGFIKTYHIMGELGGVPIRSLLERVFREFRCGHMFAPFPSGPLTEMSLKALGIPKQTEAYMRSKCRYSTNKISKEYPSVVFPKFEDYATSMLEFARQNLI